MLYRQLLLKERGQECVSCAEKADVVARVKEVYHMPVLAPDFPTPPVRHSCGRRV